MTEIAHYQLNDDGSLSCYGSRTRYNRVLYGGHGHDDSARRFFTLLGDSVHGYA